MHFILLLEVCVHTTLQFWDLFWPRGLCVHIVIKCWDLSCPRGLGVHRVVRIYAKVPSSLPNEKWPESVLLNRFCCFLPRFLSMNLEGGSAMALWRMQQAVSKILMMHLSVDTNDIAAHPPSCRSTQQHDVHLVSNRDWLIFGPLLFFLQESPIFPVTKTCLCAEWVEVQTNDVALHYRPSKVWNFC